MSHHFCIPALMVVYRPWHEVRTCVSHTRTGKTIVVQQALKFNLSKKTAVLESRCFLYSLEERNKSEMCG